MSPAAPTGNEATQTAVTVKVVSARGLRRSDFGNCDPLVKCSINGNPRATCHTKVVPNEQNPQWKCTMEVSGLSINDVIHFDVYNGDSNRSADLLGKCALKVRDLLNGWKSQELQLKDTGKAGRVGTSDSYLKLEASNIVQVSGSAPHAVKLVETPAANLPKVMVTIVGARNLRNADFVGYSDPYCVGWIPNKPDCRLQTPMIKDDLNPKWDYTGQIANFDRGDVLNFTVYDEDVGSKDLLGRCMVRFDELPIKGTKTLVKKLTESGKDARDAEIDLEFVVTPAR